MQKLLIGILTITTVTLGVLCAVQWKQLRAGHERTRAAEEAQQAEAETREAQTARLETLERTRERLEQQVREFTAVTTMLRTNEARQADHLTALAARTQTAGIPGADTDASPGDSKSGLFGKGMGKMLGTMMKDPAMREMMRGQQKATLNMMYAGLFKEMNLAPDEKEKLMGILTDAQMKNIENAQGMFGEEKEGEEPGEQPQKKFADAKQQTDAELKALLGDERFAQYEEYQKSLGERMQLDQLNTHMTAQNLPLQDQQKAQLLQAMNEEKAAVPPVISTDNTQMPQKEMFTTENLDRQIKWMEDYHRRVLDRAGRIMTPEQLKQYKDFQDQQISMQIFGLKMAGEMYGKGNSGTPPAPIPAK